MLSVNWKTKHLYLKNLLFFCWSNVLRFRYLHYPLSFIIEVILRYACYQFNALQFQYLHFAMNMIIEISYHDLMLKVQYLKIIILILVLKLNAAAAHSHFKGSYDNT